MDIEERGRKGFFCKFHLTSSTIAQPRRHIGVTWDLDLYSDATLVEGPKCSPFKLEDPGDNP